MSDREMYCDRDPYNRDSSDIIFGYPKNSIKSNIELEYYEYYQKLQSKYWHSNNLIRIYKDILKKGSCPNMSEYYQQKINIELSNIGICEKLLSKLELTTPIENMLQRERKPNETITLRYLNRELPNIPHNVFSTHTNFYLSNEEILLIKNFVAENETNSKPKEQKLKPKQSIEIIEETQNIKDGVKNKSNYILCAAIGFILSILYLLGIADMGYSYYQFLRVISFILIPILLYFYWHIEEDDESMKIDIIHIPLAFIWILFNPILPITLSKGVWKVLDLICASVLFVVNMFIYYKTKKKKG